jgi:8-oxo-dGTP pyrophosphatase MutT (NUDIX family)
LRLKALCRFMKARHKQPVKTAAGVLPYALHEGRVLFLFHKTFSGRRAGLLVDFGGGAQAAETAFETAAREFVEETEGLFLAPDLRRASRVGDEYRRQFREMQALLARTQEAHANWWCRRHVQPGKQAKDWCTYFVEVGYRDVAGMNAAWAADAGRRFKKRRELLWVPADQLLEIFTRQPERLWKRVRELETAPDVIITIRQVLEARGQPG